MIPIKEAIEAGAWLEFIDSKNEIQFRFKPTNFSKVDLNKIHNPEYLETSVDSNVWVLSFDYVNTTKETFTFKQIAVRLILMDSEEFRFQFLFDDSYLLKSDFAKNLGVEGNLEKKIPPKTNKFGGMLFELPDCFEELFIAVIDSDFCELREM